MSGSRLSRARSVISGPSEAMLSVRMLAWASVLPLLKRSLPLPRLVALMVPKRRPPGPDPTREQAVVTLARWVYKTRAIRDNCLERSLITYRYLPSGDEDSRLVLGVRKGDDGPPGHAWLTLHGVAVHDSQATLDDLVPIVAFDLEGRRRAVPGSVSAEPPGALA
jgi:hypothetical protein